MQIVFVEKHQSGDGTNTILLTSLSITPRGAVSRRQNSPSNNTLKIHAQIPGDKENGAYSVLLQIPQVI